jgi:hypothetical protein
MRNLEKYSIPPEALETGKILECWTWMLGTNPGTPVAWSLFGDPFFVAPDGRIQRLDILQGNMVDVAKTRAEFQLRAELDSSRVGWFQGPLVDQMIEQGVLRGVGQIYGFRKLPMRGGSMTWDNVELTNPVNYHKVVSQIHQQSQDFPTEIRVSSLNLGGARKSRKWWQLWK